MKVLNLGCGNVVVDSWTNVDINPVCKNVKKMNFLRRIDFPTESIDVVYLSHVLEHVSIEDVLGVVHEIYRVLRPGGIARIVVPDLENLTREYLTALELERRTGKDAWKRMWLTIELLDQMTRGQTGGLMKIWYHGVASRSKTISDFVFSRVGEKIEVKKQEYELETDSLPELAVKHNKKPNKWQRFAKDKLRKGEKHLWMWDELSLRALSDSAGFTKFTRQTAFTSELFDFFNQVDLDEFGNPRKGSSSIYVELQK